MTAPTPSDRTTVLYDGWCTLCRASAGKLRRLDRHNRLDMVDLRTDNTLAQRHNLDPTEVRRVMHAITPDGRVLVAMDALRATMHATGRGWMLAWTRLPVLAWVCDRLYLLLANNRLSLFGRSRACDEGCPID